MTTASLQSRWCAASRHNEERGTFKNVWNRWEMDYHYRKSQIAIGWNDELVRYLDHIVQIDISHDAPAEQRGRHSYFGESTWFWEKEIILYNV